MGDMGDLYNAHRKARQDKRAANRENAAVMLLEAGISFQSKNMGAHLIVSHNGKVVDFWPGTGKWMVRVKEGIARRGFGVRSLMKEVQRG